MKYDQREHKKPLLFCKRNKTLIVRLPFHRYCPKPLLSRTGVNKDIIGAQKSCTAIIEDTPF